MNGQGEYMVDFGKYVIGYDLGSRDGDMDCAIVIKKLEDGIYLVVHEMRREHTEANDTQRAC